MIILQERSHEWLRREMMLKLNSGMLDWPTDWASLFGGKRSDERH